MQSSTAQRLMEMFNLMSNHLGPQHWWPGETPLEIMVGAVLTQNTSWKNVERAIGNLKREKMLSLDALRSISINTLAENIRPTGYFNIKAGRLKNLVDFIVVRYDGDMDGFLKSGTGELREGLLSVKGIGPETADSIILYAAWRPVFVIDAYTHRILNRHGMADDQAGYYDLQRVFMDNLPEDVGLFNEFHALIVNTGKEFCRKKPICSSCPLENW